MYIFSLLHITDIAYHKLKLDVSIVADTHTHAGMEIIVRAKPASNTEGKSLAR